MLVVQGREDEGAQRLTATLRSRGDDVHIVHDGSAGVAAADALKPDIVLFDLGFDGHEACRRIRDEPWGRRICVVARSRPADPRTNAGRARGGRTVHRARFADRAACFSAVGLSDMARIVDVGEATKPIASAIRNAYIDFSKMTTSLVAVVTDVVRDGWRVVGYGASTPTAATGRVD